MEYFSKKERGEPLPWQRRFLCLMESKNIQPTVHIDVISDVTCPWCYIGKRRLENAIGVLSEKFDIVVEYHPFELNPHVSVQGTGQKEFLANKFGSQDHYERISSHVAQIASQEGLLFDFEKQMVLPNTRKIHALILFSKSSGKQTELVEHFFKAYFTDGVDLSDNEKIIEIAAQSGIERPEAEKIITDERSMNLIAEAEKNVQDLGIHAVPFYIINSKYGVSGAQPSDVFVKTIEDIGFPGVVVN